MNQCNAKLQCLPGAELKKACVGLLTSQSLCRASAHQIRAGCSSEALWKFVHFGVGCDPVTRLSVGSTLSSFPLHTDTGRDPVRNPLPAFAAMIRRHHAWVVSLSLLLLAGALCGPAIRPKFSRQPGRPVATPRPLEVSKLWGSHQQASWFLARSVCAVTTAILPPLLFAFGFLCLPPTREQCESQSRKPEMEAGTSVDHLAGWWAEPPVQPSPDTEPVSISSTWRSMTTCKSLLLRPTKTENTSEIAAGGGRRASDFGLSLQAGWPSQR